jgi:hypothetical protein
VVKRFVMMLAVVVLAAAASVNAQQKPATAAEKEAAEQKAAMEAMAKMAAQQAEAVARAQQKVAEEARRTEEERIRRLEATEMIPVDVEVVVSRYQGDKKVSSLPYFLAINANGEASLRMGANVPVPTNVWPAGTVGPVAPISFNYQNIGTDIDATVRPRGEGRFFVRVKVEERSVVQPPASATPISGTVSGAPVIRSFAAQNELILRDGQTRQFTAAADRVTGEVVKVDVTLKVLK